MTEAVSSAPAPIGLAHRMSTRAAFLVAGFSVSAWAPLIPYAKGRLHLSDGRLGLLLLCLGTGSVLGMPTAGALAAKYGCRAMIVLTGLLLAGMLPVLATAAHAWPLAAALLAFGAGLGILDVTMNIQAVIVERASDRPVMSGFHGMYSVGGIAGAGCVGLMMAAGVSPAVAAAAVLGLVVCVLAVSYPALLPYGGQAGGPAFVVPRGRVLLLGCFCFVMFLAEGSVLDWSAVFLNTMRQTDASHAGLGYVAYSVAMTGCRLAGDGIVRVVGPARVVLFGPLCAAFGFVLAVTVPSTAAGVVGFALVGVGASNVVPVMFSAAGRQTAMPANLAIAAITTLGYAGILLGPALVGLFAHLVGLPAGLAIVAGLLVVVAVTSTRVRLQTPGGNGVASGA